MDIQAPYKIKLYSSKYYVATDSASEVLASTVSALADVESIELYCYTYFCNAELESDNIKGNTAISIENSKLRYGYQFKLNEYTIATDLDEIDDLETVLSLKHKYIEFITSPYDFVLQKTNYLTAVVLTGLDNNIESGIKTITLEFEKRKPKQ